MREAPPRFWRRKDTGNVYYLNGTITLLDANLAVVDCGGVGYACHTTNYTLARLQLGKSAKLFTYCNIKEDAFDIFGFPRARN